MRWGLEVASFQWHRHSLLDVEKNNSGLGRNPDVVGRIVALGRTALLADRSRFEGLEVGENR